MRWISGIFLSFIFAWVVSLFFVTSIKFYTWDPVLQEPVHRSGTYTHRTEGWGTTMIGKHGIHGVEDITSVAMPKVIFWGDSFVEAWQVDDVDKVAQAFTGLARQNDLNLFGFGVGRSGDDIQDYFLRLQKFERLSPPVFAHVIVLGHMEDIFPGKEITFTPPSPSSSMSFPRPHPVRQFVKNVIHALKLSLLRPLMLFTKQEHSLRFTPGKKTASPISEKPVDDLPKQQYDEYWENMLQGFNELASAPLIFVYCPAVPEIRENAVVFEDEHAALARRFKTKCLQYNVGFINMEEPFLRLYEEEQLFPRGFATSAISKGHFNPEGHLLVANEVIRYISKHHELLSN